MQKIQFEYFRGMEAEQYSFYRVPKILFTAECFKSLSCEAKVLYGLLLDRMSLSIKNRWFDEEDRVYIVFTVEEIAELLNCGTQKAVKLMKELDTEKGIGLIEKRRLGLGKPNVIYVKNFMVKDCPETEKEEELPLTSGITEPEKALGGMSRAEIEETVLCYAQAQLEDMGLADEVKLNAARVYGSRTREDLYNDGSDVDVVLSYTGNIREDDFFSALHEEGMEMVGLPLDINPISTEKTGTLQEYLEQAEKYLDGKRVRDITSAIVKFEIGYEIDRDMLEFWDGEAEIETEPIYQVYEIIGNAVERKDTGKFQAHLEQVIREHRADEPITEAAADLLGKLTGKVSVIQKEPKISFYVAECMEFPILGEYHDNLTLEEVVQKYEEIPPDRINGIKGIGFRLEDGSMYDGDYELMSAGVILKDSIDLVHHYKESPLVQQAIVDLEQILSDRRREKNAEKPQEKQVQKEPEQAQEPQVPIDKEKAVAVPETAPEPQKQLEMIPGKDNSVPEGTGRKQSVLKALRERQAKLKQEQEKTEQKVQNHKKGEQEL